MGAQLFQKYGRAIFPYDDASTIHVTAGLTAKKAEVVGRFIKDLYTLPFLPPSKRDLNVLAGITTSEGRVVGEKIERLVTDVSMLEEETLLHIALLNPIRKIQDLYPREKVLVLIDALDESLQHAGKHILDVIPRHYDSDTPFNLRILLTSRPGDHLVAFRSEDILDLGDEKKGYPKQERLKDTRAYIARRIAEPSLAEALAAWDPLQRDAFLLDVETISAGNFLYLYHFFNVAVMTLTGNPVSAKRLRMPADLDEIYRFFAIDRIKASTNLRDWVELFLPLLGVLAVVREPVGRELLAAFARVRVEYVDYIRGQIAQFLDIVHEDLGDRYRLYHSSFAEYLMDPTRNRDYPLDLSAQHRRIAAYYRAGHDGWAAVDWDAVTDDYPFRHLPTHLASADKSLLYELIDKPWMLAKLKHTHSHHSFSGDVSLAISVAGRQQPPDIVQEVRFCLIYATLGTLAIYLPPEALSALAQLGELERAIGLASLIPRERERSLAWIDIAHGLIASHQTESAKSVVERALETAKGMPDEWIRSELFAKVAAVLAQIGERERALDLTETATLDDKERAEAFESVMTCTVQQEKGDTEQITTRVLAAAETIGDPTIQVDVMCRIARALARAGRAQAASDIVTRILATVARLVVHTSDVLDLLQVLIKLTEVDRSKIPNELMDSLLQAVEAMRNPRSKAKGLSRVSQLQLWAGESAKAADVMDRAVTMTLAAQEEWRRRDEDEYEIELSTMGVTLVRVGKLQRALQLLKAITYLEPSANVLREAAMAVTSAQQYAQVLAAAETIDQPWTKAYGLGEVAQLFARAGEREKALHVAERALAGVVDIAEEWAKDSVISAVSVALAQIGEVRRAVGEVESIRAEFERAMALGRMAAVLARAGDSANAADAAGRAVATAMAVGDQSARGNALRMTAQTLVAAGLFTDAVAAALAIGKKEADHYEYELGQVAQALASAGEIDHALSVLELLNRPRTRAQMLSQLALCLIERGGKSLALDLVMRALAESQAIEDRFGEADAMAEICVGLARVREIDRALAAAMEMGGPHVRAAALCGVAQAFAEAGNVNGVDRAFAIGTAIEDESAQSDAMTGFVDVLLQVGQLPEAWAAAQKIRDEGDKSVALAAIADALIEAREDQKAKQMMDLALVLSEASLDKSKTALTLSRLAQVELKRGDADRAEGLAVRSVLVDHERRDESINAGVLTTAAQVLLKAGMTGHLTPERVEGLESEIDRAWLLSAVDIAFAMSGGNSSGTGRKSGVMAALKHVTNDRTFNLERLATAVARSNCPALALLIAEAIDMRSNAWALAEVALAFARAGDREKAIEISSRARIAASHAGISRISEGISTELLCTIAKALGLVGEIPRAAETVLQALETAHGRGEIQTVVAALSTVISLKLQEREKQTVQGVLEQALQVAELKRDDERRAEALSGVAQVLFQAGEPEKALRIFRRAFTTARLAGRQGVFEVLESGAATLATIDRGESLWRIRESVQEVNGWWPTDSGE